MGDGQARRVIFASRRRRSDRIAGLRAQVEDMQPQVEDIGGGLCSVAAELDELAAVVHCDDGTAIRLLIVWRGQTFTEVLHAELTAARLRSMEERRPSPL